ncbi:hypothetical protein B4Q04_10975 [Zobellia sp. OII3]|nr:hypothetical protein B4Q04_10975 [Zobellia sp. OII3]
MLYSYFIFGLVLIFVYIFFWKPSGLSQQDEANNKSEAERKKNIESNIEIMKEMEEDFVCFFCASNDFKDKEEFHAHIEKCRN